MLLFCSSFLFLTNVLTTFYKQYYIYSFLFFMLTLTSLVFHYNPTPITARIDQVFVFLVVAWGGKVLYSKLPANPFKVALIVLTCLVTGYLYTWGFYTQQYCFNADKCLGDRYHCLLHVIGSVGHHLLTFL